MDAINIIEQAEEKISGIYQKFEQVAYQNQIKVINAFKEHRVRDFHFSPSSGYGYGDTGRDLLEDIYAKIFLTEDALVRSQIVSGTHAISACLFGLLEAGDELISITGSPYDTLGMVIGKNQSIKGTLIDKGIRYREVPLDRNGHPDFVNIADAVSADTRMVMIQRSRGYNLRPSLHIETITGLLKVVKEKNPATIVFVDNCYGEFTDIREPGELGADIIAGSLIKNPGGGLAPSGGYIAGKKDLIEQISYHITAPGLGKEIGATLINKTYIYQGLFLAPHVVLQALKGACLLSCIFARYGYNVFPKWDEPRADIVQVIEFQDAEEVLRFCQIIQSNSPIDSDVTLEYAHLPGYDDKIVMAAGTFIQGSSIEMSCDAPMRYPYCAFIQGGLTYEHYRYVIEKIVDRLILHK
jgi:cystathionine beta-lyase family protein involved in aluminum resistance